MAESKTTQAPRKPEPASGVSAGWARPEFHGLPLELAARIATGNAHLSALRRLEPGSVIPLDTPVGEPTHLVAGGAVIGAGEIVEVKGRLALRLTRVGPDRG